MLVDYPLTDEEDDISAGRLPDPDDSAEEGELKDEAVALAPAVRGNALVYTSTGQEFVDEESFKEWIKEEGLWTS